ncbi:MAG: hypothetical protein SFV54_07120 [Bryobacteraceae bacterium]|nr:hypothetical protein [Bryobacteraceae bacterium]
MGAEIAHGAVRFQIPDGFRDTTNYTFKHPKVLEEVRVQFENLDRYRPTLDAVLADRADYIKSVMGDRIALEPPVPLVVFGRPARQMDFTFEEKGAKCRNRSVLVQYTDPAYFELSYQALDAVVLRNWAPIFESMQLGGYPPQLPPPSPGFSRRTAGLLTAALPQALEPPKAYLFTLEQARLTVSFRVLDGPPLPLPQLILKETAPGDAISDTKEFNVETPAGACAFYRYLITRDGPAEPTLLAAVRGRLSLTGAAGLVHLYGQAPPAQANALERGFALLLNSFRLEAK